jgi:hypothetical protein
LFHGPFFSHENSVVVRRFSPFYIVHSASFLELGSRSHIKLNKSIKSSQDVVIPLSTGYEIFKAIRLKYKQIPRMIGLTNSLLFFQLDTQNIFFTPFYQ